MAKLSKQAQRTADAEAPTPLAMIDGVAVWCAHDEIVPTEKIIGNPRNPNRHPEKQVAALGKVIKGQGWRAPITISRHSGFVVRGHGRYAAALDLGLSAVPVDFQEYEDDANEWADMVADNRIAEMAEMDKHALRDILTSMQDSYQDLDIELTGYTATDIDSLIESTAPKDGIDLDENQGLPDALPEDGDENVQADGKIYHCPKCGFEFKAD